MGTEFRRGGQDACWVLKQSYVVSHNSLRCVSLLSYHPGHGRSFERRLLALATVPVRSPSSTAIARFAKKALIPAVQAGRCGEMLGDNLERADDGGRWYWLCRATRAPDYWSDVRSISPIVDRG